MKVAKHTKAILAVCISMTSLAGAAVVEKPSVMPDTMGCIVVSDIHGFLDGVGRVAAQASPMMNGMMIKSMLGMQLGDPGLAGIPLGKGLAVVIVDQTNAFAVIEVGEMQMAAYTSALAAKGIQSQGTEGVLVVAKTSEEIAKGAALVPVVKESLLARRSPDLKVTLQPASLIAQNDVQIQGMLQMMPMMMGMGMQQTPGMDLDSIQSMTRILEAEVRVLLSLARQCDTAGIILSPKDGSLTISETVVPKEGSRLDALINAPKISTPNPKVQAGLLGEAAVGMDATMGNPEAIADFFVAETEQVITEMNLQDLDVSGIVSTLKKWMNIYSGSFSETVEFGGENGFSVNYALAVKDEAAALALFKTLKEDMGPFLTMYENMGMPMTVEFKENARAYKEVNIHQFKVTMSFEQLPEEQRMQMTEMNLTNMLYEVAIVDSVMLYSMGEARMETLIDRITDDAFTAPPLKAREVYPAGAFYYCDFDVAKYMTFVASMMPEDAGSPLPQIAPMLNGTDPVTSAGFSEDGAVMWSVTIPGSLIGKVGQVAMMMQMQKMQQPSQTIPQGGIPMDVPDDLPAAPPSP